jgi:hypothetical protein
MVQKDNLQEMRYLMVNLKARISPKKMNYLFFIFKYGASEGADLWTICLVVRERKYSISFW